MGFDVRLEVFETHVFPRGHLFGVDLGHFISLAEPHMVEFVLDEAEAEIAAGGGIPDEEAWEDLEEELELERRQELEMAEMV